MPEPKKPRNPSPLSQKMKAIRRVEEAKIRLAALDERERRYFDEIREAREKARSELAAAQEGLAAFEGPSE